MPREKHDPAGEPARNPDVHSLLQELEQRRDRVMERIKALQKDYEETQTAIRSIRWALASGHDDPTAGLSDEELEAMLSPRARAQLDALARALCGPREACGPQLERQFGPLLARAPEEPLLRPMSMPSAAREVLRAAGEPLHVDQILERLERAGLKVKRDSLVTGLARLAASGVVFARVQGQPNVFALRDWKP